VADSKREKLQREVVDIDAAMRDALSQESSEVLRHQLERERHVSAQMSRSDYFVAFLLSGFGVGVGVASTSGWLRKRLRKNRSSR
jgi:allophanate hydrolase subunit 1